MRCAWLSQTRAASSPSHAAAHQLVLGEAARQAREAGIPEALRGPQAPGGERADSGGAGPAVEKVSALQKKLQAGQFLM